MSIEIPASAPVTEFSGIGFAPGVVTGARSFDVDKLGRLTGVNYHQVWTPDENAAICRKDENSGGMFGIYGTSIWTTTFSPPAPKSLPTKKDAPHALETCKCGFYGYYDGSNDYHDRSRVSAVVEGYGETLIGTRGFRAMKARIVALHISKGVPELLAEKVRRNYSAIPLFNTFKSMVQAFPPDGAGMELTPASDPEFWTRTV